MSSLAGRVELVQWLNAVCVAQYPDIAGLSDCVLYATVLEMLTPAAPPFLQQLHSFDCAPLSDAGAPRPESARGGGGGVPATARSSSAVSRLDRATTSVTAKRPASVSGRSSSAALQPAGTAATAGAVSSVQQRNRDSAQRRRARLSNAETLQGWLTAPWVPLRVRLDVDPARLADGRLQDHMLLLRHLHRCVSIAAAASGHLRFAADPEGRRLRATLGRSCCEALTPAPDAPCRHLHDIWLQSVAAEASPSSLASIAAPTGGKRPERQSSRGALDEPATRSPQVLHVPDAAQGDALNVAADAPTSGTDAAMGAAVSFRAPEAAAATAAARRHRMDQAMQLLGACTLLLEQCGAVVADGEAAVAHFAAKRDELRRSIGAVWNHCAEAQHAGGAARELYRDVAAHIQAALASDVAEGHSGSSTCNPRYVMGLALKAPGLAR